MNGRVAMRQAFLPLILIIALALSMAQTAGAADKGTAKGDPSAKKVTITGFPDYTAAGTGRHPDITVEYRDSCFSKSAYKTNKALLSLSAAASASTYAPSGQTEKFLKQCGFSKLKSGKTGTSTKAVGSNDNASYCFGIRKTKINGRKQCIVAVIIRGYTKNGYEWVSNFNLGDGQLHTGFSTAAEKVYQKLKSYIAGNTRGYAGKDIKVWLTGHSRGAAIANLAGIELCDPLFPGESAMANKENVYVIGFATPRYIQPWDASKNYQNILNVIVPEDMVPELAPAKWGYQRYGRSVVLKNRNKMKTLFRQMAGRKYEGITAADRKDLIDLFCEFGGSQYDYTRKKHTLTPVDGSGSKAGKQQNGAGLSVTAAEYVQKGIGLAMASALFHTKNTGYEKLLNAYRFEPSDPGNRLTILLALNKTGISDAHIMGTYLAWVNAAYGGITAG